MDKLDLIFYKNTFINREIAFILDVKYDYIDDLKEKIVDISEFDSYLENSRKKYEIKA